MASYQFVYHMDGVSKTYPGGKKVFENIHLNFLPGVKIGVVGVNGAGKSTLLKVMAGIDKDFQGEAWAAKGAKVGYLPQEPYLDPQLNVRGNVMEGVAAKQAKLDRYNDLAMNYSDETADEMARLQDEIDAENLWDLDNQVDIAMEALRCPPDDADVETLSGGERRRVALCKLLLEAPDMLLLDEPTNHLDAETIAWLQKHLIAYKGTILTVTHDRYFLDDITTWILELERGRGLPHEGNYSSWLEAKAKRVAQEAREDKAKQKVMEKELEWIRAGAKARQAKSKARISAYNKMADESVKDLVGSAQIVIPHGPRLGNKVIEVEGLSKAMGDKQLIENLTFSLPPGGIIGVIGPNGAGKSTLFKMLTGLETPDAGSVTVGDTVKLAYVDQSRDALDPDKNVWEEISGGAEVIELGDAQVNSRNYVGSFFTAMALAFQPLRRLGSLTGTWQIAAASLERIYAILDMRPAITSGPRTELPPDTTIRLQDVRMSYDGHPVLNGLSLQGKRNPVARWPLPRLRSPGAGHGVRQRRGGGGAAAAEGRDCGRRPYLGRHQGQRAEQ